MKSFIHGEIYSIIFATKRKHFVSLLNTSKQVFKYSWSYQNDKFSFVLDINVSNIHTKIYVIKKKPKLLFYVSLGSAK